MSDKLTIDLIELGNVLNQRGHYALALRLDKPESRGYPYEQEWTNKSLKEYLELHCGEDESEKIFKQINPAMELLRDISDWMTSNDYECGEEGAKIHNRILEILKEIA
jgi:hypothetical protein